MNKFPKNKIWNKPSVKRWIKRLRKKNKPTLNGYKTDNHVRIRKKHPESYTLKNLKWEGMITLKFHSTAYSKDDQKGEGRKNRFAFVEAYMNNLRKNFKISDREFIWFASEEFGISGMGHIHVMFSFDYLREKNRKDKIPQIDFSKFGNFLKEANESKDFICRYFKIKTSTVDIRWSPEYDNEGLIHYVCKVEFGRDEKFFKWSKGWGNLKMLKAP